MKKWIFLLIIALFAAGLAGAQDDEFASERIRMVEKQLERRGVTDPRILEAMKKVKRHLFVPKRVRGLSYEDTPLPIGYDQTISQPYIVAYMTEVAGIKPGDKVLEIGTGSGYQAAVLAEIAGEVYTVEIVKPLADTARTKLEDMGFTNVHVRWGDGYKGWPQNAPFDVIIVTAAPPEVPQVLVEQLKVGGRMVIPVGIFFQEIYLVTKTESGIEKKALLPVRFVPMVHPKKGKD
jgi:protein-L-isoaspartate(D-aspartate) O-methyltransferase